MTDVMIEVKGLRVVADGAQGAVIELVKGVDFTVKKGEVLALIGESGSGKTTIALSLLGYTRQGCRFAGGSVRVADIDVLALDEKGRRALRSRKVAYVAQSAAAGFNPARTLMDQVTEPALLHRLMSREASRAKAVELFRALALPSPETIGNRYPHQVSGGQLQRLMAAMALITDPAVIVFDEPTTALDVTTQIEVLAAFKRVIKEVGTTAVYVSHDLAVVAQMADRIVVLNGGEVQECGDVDQVLDAPTHAYTRALLAASARREGQASDARQAASVEAATPLLEIRGLSAGYGRIGRDGHPAVCVLDDVNLSIPRGSALGVIGESGSGKTTLARVVAGLVERTSGDVLFEGRPLSSTLSGRTADQYRRIQLVFQNADTALNPSHTVEEILGRPLAFYMGLRGAEAKRRIADLLDLVKLPASTASRRPGALSGGQKQRVNFARALAAEPSLILCDEVTSALDTVVGAAILDLLRELRGELGVSYMFISHDISTVRAVCDDVIVLYAGRCVEAAQPRLLDQPPHHPYTGLLVDSVPALKRGWLDARRNIAACALPPLSNGTGGPELCSFRARCSARIEGKCNAVRPPLRKLPSGAQILCHRSADELKLLQPLRGAA